MKTDEIPEIFKKRGLKPLRNKWYEIYGESVYCCGITAMWLEQDFENRLEYLKTGQELILMQLADSLNLHPYFINDFTAGWDNKYSTETEACIKGKQIRKQVEGAVDYGKP